jgi:phosphoglycolate phosphatase
MKKEKIIIFDFDGVIADSFDIALEVNQMSKPTLTHEQYEQVWNNNITDVVYKHKVVKKIDFHKEYAKKFKTLPLKGNIKTALKALSSEFKLFIVSSTITNTISDYLKRHEIFDCFTEILGNDVETSKIKKFKMLFDKYKINPAEITFISDTSGDINEAKKVNIGYIIGILDGYQTRESIKKAGPNVIVKNFNDFFQLIKKRKF